MAHIVPLIHMTIKILKFFEIQHGASKFGMVMPIGSAPKWLPKI